MNTKEMAKRERKNRIDQLGGWGTRRTQVVKSKTKYTRKSKHKERSY